jgi:aquaporin Z
MIQALKNHWPEYLMEAAGLGIFMISAGLFATLLEHPDLPFRTMFVDPLIRRLLMGSAMGITAVFIIYSPWGKRSGAHINPAVTLTFFRLGKITGWDAFFYILAQCIGGFVGLEFIAIILISFISHPTVNFVVTVPGSGGVYIAFVAEMFISAVLMIVIMFAMNRKSLNSYTGLFAGILVALFILFEAPLSGMSINPARTFASAVPANLWTAFWLYMTAPPLGMLIAAEIYIRVWGINKVYCAKLHHENQERCIFNCSYSEIPEIENKISEK